MSTNNLKDSFRNYLATDNALTALEREFKSKRAEIMASRATAARAMLATFQAKGWTKGIKLTLDGETYSGVLPYEGTVKGSGKPTVRVRMDRPREVEVIEVDLDDSEDIEFAAE